METNVQTYISLGHVLVRTTDKWMDGDNLILMSKSEATVEMLKHLDAKRKYLEEFPASFADDWKFDEREDWETISHWYDHMRERAENGLSISLSQDEHLYTKEVYVPYHIFQFQERQPTLNERCNMKKIKEKSPWIRAIDLLHERIIAEHYDKDIVVEAGGETWQITNYKYSSARHRLTVEFDGGEFYIVFEYSEQNERLCVEAWVDRYMLTDDTDTDSDDEGRDEDSVMVLQLIFLPKIKSRRQAEKSLMLRDADNSLLIARQAEVAFFAFLIGKLEEYAGFSHGKVFDFRSALEYAQKEETLWEAFQLMKRGMSDFWSQTAKDWDTLSDC